MGEPFPWAPKQPGTPSISPSLPISRDRTRTGVPSSGPMSWGRGPEDGDLSSPESSSLPLRLSGAPCIFLQPQEVTQQVPLRSRPCGGLICEKCSFYMFKPAVALVGVVDSRETHHSTGLFRGEIRREATKEVASLKRITGS